MEIQDIAPADLTNLQAQGYTEQDLSMLAKSEVAALLAPASSDDDDRPAGGADHDKAAKEQDDAAKAADPAAQAAAAANATVEADAAAAAGGGAADEGTKDTTAAFVTQFKVELPADAKEQIAALKAEANASFTALMKGEIEPDAYQAVKDRTEAAIDDLKEKTLTASIFQKANEQTAEQNSRNEWTRAETAAMNSFKDEGLDYKAKPALLAAYNTHLKALAADPKNERRDAPWFLAESHRLTKLDLGIVTVQKKDGGGGRNGVATSELPPTLRSVPVAATGAIGADEFAHMRNLEGLELERAHARLTNEQRDRWMAE